MHLGKKKIPVKGRILDVIETYIYSLMSDIADAILCVILKYVKFEQGTNAVVGKSHFQWRILK